MAVSCLFLKEELVIAVHRRHYLCLHLCCVHFVNPLTCLLGAHHELHLALLNTSDLLWCYIIE